MIHGMTYIVFTCLILYFFVGFGLIIDRLGRKIGLILTTAFVIIGAALCAASSGTTATGLLWMMVISRGIMGVGVGGEYPCSSVSAIESSDEVAPGRRGGLVILVSVAHANTITA